jgi:hypothetical protein
MGKVSDDVLGLLAWMRDSSAPSEQAAHIGFRCAK